MRARFIIIGMTPSAIRPVRWKPPVDCLAVSSMTSGTNHTEAVISRIASGGVTEVYGRPVGSVVAFVTLYIGHKMSGGFSGCGCPIMTSGATSRYQTMVHVGR